MTVNLTNVGNIGNNRAAGRQALTDETAADFVELIDNKGANSPEVMAHRIIANVDGKSTPDQIQRALEVLARANGVDLSAAGNSPLALLSSGSGRVMSMYDKDGNPMGQLTPDQIQRAQQHPNAVNVYDASGNHVGWTQLGFSFDNGRVTTTPPGSGGGQHHQADGDRDWPVYKADGQTLTGEYVSGFPEAQAKHLLPVPDLRNPRDIVGFRKRSKLTGR